MKNPVIAARLIIDETTLRLKIIRSEIAKGIPYGGMFALAVIHTHVKNLMESWTDDGQQQIPDTTEEVLAKENSSARERVEVYIRENPQTYAPDGSKACQVNERYYRKIRSELKASGSVVGL